MTRRSIATFACLLLLLPIVAGCASRAARGGPARAPCRVHGNVYHADGSYATDVKIRLQVDCGSGWSDGDGATTGDSGEFAFDVELKPGCRFRCSSLGDVVTQQWSGAGQLYFRLMQRPGKQDDYDPFQEL